MRLLRPSLFFLLAAGLFAQSGDEAAVSQVVQRYSHRTAV
jgi:hypothetical protein